MALTVGGLVLSSQGEMRRQPEPQSTPGIRTKSPQSTQKFRRCSMGKPWENHGKTMGKP